MLECLARRGWPPPRRNLHEEETDVLMCFVHLRLEPQNSKTPVKVRAKLCPMLHKHVDHDLLPGAALKRPSW